MSSTPGKVVDPDPSQAGTSPWLSSPSSSPAVAIWPANLLTALQNSDGKPKLTQPASKHVLTQRLHVTLNRLLPGHSMDELNAFLAQSPAWSPSYPVPVEVRFATDQHRHPAPGRQPFLGPSYGHLVIHAAQSNHDHSFAELAAIRQDDPHNPRAAGWSTPRRAIPQPGEGSLLDALVLLEQNALVQLRSELAVSRGTGPTPQLVLATEAFLLERFLDAPYSRAKHLVVEALFPPAQASGEAAGISNFYQALHRAPRTAGGLAGCAGESAEECAGRERRAAKGKARAADDEPRAGEADEILRPLGLIPTLMPFQSASVRWLLAREGLFAPPTGAGAGGGGGRGGGRGGGGGAGSTYSRDGGDSGCGGGSDVKMIGTGVKDESDDDGMIVIEEGGGGDGDGVRLERLPLEDRALLARGPLWEKVQLTPPSPANPSSTCQLEENVFFLNRVTCQLSRSDPGLAELGALPRGGMLCEEVGLGKTVEVIALILLHQDRRRNALPTFFDAGLLADIQPSGLTLVVAPAAIVAQWAAELVRHAPGLRVLRYETAAKLQPTQTAAHVAAHFDVILATYDTMRREVHFAKKPHERALRSRGAAGGRARYRRGLFVELEYLRVILDEVQMVGDAASNTSEVAARIPRLASFAVSSTPLKGGKIDDLLGLLRFLQVDLGPRSRHGLERLLADAAMFERVVRTLGIRTTKAQVAEDELVIPPQTRWCVPIEFGSVEQYYYDQQYNHALATLGLDQESLDRLAQGADWLPDKAELNRALSNLRSVCTHPQVGHAGQQQLGTVGRALKTVEEVLGSMREMAQNAVWADERALLAARIKKAHLLMFDAESCEHWEEALELFLQAQQDLPKHIGQLIADVRRVQQEKRELAGEPVQAGSAQPSVGGDDGEEALAAALAMSDDGQDDPDRRELDLERQPKTDKERALETRAAFLQTRLREFVMLRHAALFLGAGVYFNLGKEAMSELERASYAEAEKLRSTLLLSYEEKVDRIAVSLKAWLEARETEHPIEVTNLEIPFSNLGGGIIGRPIFDALEESSDILNAYAEIVWSWREQIITFLLTSKLSIAGDDATGEEYAERAANQEEADILLEAYSALLADWRAGLSGEMTELTKQLTLEVIKIQRRAHPVGTAANTAKRIRNHQLAKGFLSAEPALERGSSPADLIRWRLFAERLRAKGEGRENTEVRPVRMLLQQLKDARDRADPDEEPEERALLEAEMKRVRKVLGGAMAVADRLKAELAKLTSAFNTRVEYFRQLQIINDDVQDPDPCAKAWRGLPVEIEEREEAEKRVLGDMDKKRNHLRYLTSLATNDLEGSSSKEAATCPICLDADYDKGILTDCGHRVCASCWKTWRSTSSACPICRQALRTGAWQLFNNKTVEGVPAPVPQLGPTRAEAVAAARAVVNGSAAQAGEEIALYEGEGEVEPESPLQVIQTEEAAAIARVGTVSPLSSKTDFLVKHVKLLRQRDPLAKIVLFSAFTEALAVVMQAFARNAIGFCRLEANGKKEAVVQRFVEDPSVAVFLLHSRSQSAGLNLTCAQYVMLVEPLLHPALELQAVGRVHRIGQTKQTHVFQYFIRNTVDARVAELRAVQGTSLFLQKAVDAAEEGKTVENDWASRQAGKGAGGGMKASEEAIDDEDDIARVLLDRKDYARLQGRLLPDALRAVPAPAERGAGTETVEARTDAEVGVGNGVGRAVGREMMRTAEQAGLDDDVDGLGDYGARAGASGAVRGVARARR